MSARAKRPSDEVPTEIHESGARRRAKSEPIRAISMKTPAEVEPEKHHGTPAIHKVKLRAISEVKAPQNLGYLAPPRDPAEVRARRMRDYVIWGCVAVMLGSVVALAVWFLAR